MSLRFKIILLAILLIFSYWLFKPVGNERKILEIDNLVKDTLSEFKVKISDLVKETSELKKIGFKRIETIAKTYVVLTDFPFDSFRSSLEKKTKNKKIEILSWEKNIREKTYRLEIGFRGIRLYSLILKAIKEEIAKVLPFKRGKVAIVIDDFGYNIKDIDPWLNFDIPITFSILPKLPYSTQIASLAHNAGKEVILHLPLEPKNEGSLAQEKFTITTKMSKKEVLKFLDEAIKSVPYLKGVSNHQGSLATEDRKLMEIILAELKKRELFFLDSLVTNKSVCQEIASHIGLRFAQRDVFLDNIEHLESIKIQLYKLAKIAQTRGFAIGIGHMHSKTLEALKEICPLLEERGIEFVYLSELVE